MNARLIKSDDPYPIALIHNLLGIYQTLVRQFSELGRDFSEFRRLLFCVVCYQAGIAVVITLAAVYAEQVMGFSMTQTIMLIITVNIAAAVGALSFGHVQDRLGHRRALTLGLLGWLMTSLTAFAAVNTIIFWFAACLAGICMGTTQSAGRAMVGAFAPADRLSRFFGFWSFATQLAAAIGPLTYGTVTWMTGGNQRLAMLSTSLFFVAALIILKNVSLARAQKQRDTSHVLFGVCKQEVRAPD
jgi:UMF1 family MFS transporter